MKTLLAVVDSSHAIGESKGARRTYVLAGVLVLAAAVILVPAAVPAFGQQAAPAPAAQAASDQNATCIVGLEHIGHNAKGKLTVESDSLHFVTEKGTARVPISAILD